MQEREIVMECTDKMANDLEYQVEADTTPIDRYAYAFGIVVDARKADCGGMH